MRCTDGDRGGDSLRPCCDFGTVLVLFTPSSFPAHVDPKEEDSNYTAELNMRS